MLEEFFQPIITKKNYKPFQIGDKIIRNQSDFPELSDVGLAIFGIGDGSLSSHNQACGLGHHTIREQFYNLVAHRSVQDQIIDLGDLKLGKNNSETQEKIKFVIHQLQQQNITCLILGGSINLGLGIFEGLSEIKNLDISLVSPTLPILENELLQKIIIHEQNNLFNINILAHQMHLVPDDCIEVLEKMNFEQCRLGAIKNNTEQIEPLVRDTDLVLFDMCAIKHAESPGTNPSYPSGLNTDMACKIARYAGISDQTKVFGIFEVNPELDHRNQTAIIAAEMMWYFIDGFFNRRNDHPSLHNDFIRYRCYFEDKMPDVIFHKSKLTNRWWMEVNIENKSNRQINTKLIPCAYEDYINTSKGNFPDLYLKALRKWG